MQLAVDVQTLCLTVWWGWLSSSSCLICFFSSKLSICQMRSTRKVSVWPVAFVGGLRYESPKVNAAGKVYGWKTVFDPHRPFAIDMAGFAINLRLILFKPQAYFKLRGVKGGYQESSLLRELVTLNDLEPKAANCTKVTYLYESLLFFFFQTRLYRVYSTRERETDICLTLKLPSHTVVKMML